MATAGCDGRRRFSLACGVLSRGVRAAKTAVGETAAAAHHGSRHATTPATASAIMLLLRGANVAPDVREEEAEASTPAPGKLTIMYRGRVLVFDDVPADKAAELLRLAAAGAKDDIPVARKASLQRFMEKRRDRLAAKAPYDTASRPTTTLASNKEGLHEEEHAGAWLGLGTPGGCVR